MSRVRREWCAMLAKLVAPMDAERAAKAFVDMLPMLPPDDTLYTRATLDEAATCDRKTAVPTFADISRVLGHAAKARLPADVRMGYANPQWPSLPPERPMTAEEREQAVEAVAALKAELRAKGCGAKIEDVKPEPSYLTPLQMALAARQCGAIMRPDWARALAEHDRGVS